jgi:DNA-directed RNA polymerase specialized sigma24 family protein
LCFRLRYLHGLEWDAAAEAMGYSLSQAYALHGLALKELRAGAREEP